MPPLHQINFGLGGGSLLQLANRCHTQMMAYRIITPTGKIDRKALAARVTGAAQ